MSAVKIATLAGATGVSYYLVKKYGLTHDIATIAKFAPAKLRTNRHIAKNETIIDVFEHTVDSMPPHHPALFYQGSAMTFKDLDDASNQVANWGLSIGLQPHDVVALYMENRPDFVAIWVGLAKIGVITAFINTHISKESLLHCLNTSGAQTIIFGSELKQEIAGIYTDLGAGKMKCFIHLEDGFDASSTPFAQNLNVLLGVASTRRPPRAIRASKVRLNDTALMIYTSGTTGMPKAACMIHSSILSRALSFIYAADATPQDRLYCALPLYHTAGGLVAVGMMMTSGLSVVLARRFSASSLWSDIRLNKCTILHYIGEFCRYLLTIPPKANDRENHIRLAMGNGLRPDIWKTFQDRYGIPTVIEFYGSTEGPGGLMNICSREWDQGHLGATGVLVDKITGLKLVKYDIDQDEHIRDSNNGRLLECNADEVGELLVRIQNKPGLTFAGYHGNKKATEKKIFRNAFHEGDMYMRTGDLFKRDSERRWYFMDRIGDTFRWKGENVATSEVAEAISQFPGLEEINIYGVQVPGHDGRACMAAMVFREDSMDFASFADYIKLKLPVYARPLFIRKLAAMKITGTFKHQKAQLRKQGMDPTKVGNDKLWFWDGECYNPLTSETYHQAIMSRL